MADYSIVQGARRPTLTATLIDATGTAINLTGATGVTFRGAQMDGTTVFSGSCTVTSAADGEVSYAWASADTAVPGLYRVEFVITWSTGITEVVPSDVTRTLQIKDAAS
jgi:hypothetical protein